MKVTEVIALWRYLGFTSIKCRTTLKKQLCFIFTAEDCTIFLPLADINRYLPSWRVAYKQHVKNFNWEANQPEYEN